MKAKIVIDLFYERQTIFDASFGGRFKKSSNSVVLLPDYLTDNLLTLSFRMSDFNQNLAFDFKSLA